MRRQCRRRAPSRMSMRCTDCAWRCCAIRASAVVRCWWRSVSVAASWSPTVATDYFITLRRWIATTERRITLDGAGRSSAGSGLVSREQVAVVW